MVQHHSMLYSAKNVLMLQWSTIERVVWLIFNFNPLLWSFFCYPHIGTERIFYIPSPGTEFFSMFTVWYGLFSFVLTFPRLRIEDSTLSTVQGKCVYKIFKVENQETQFPLLCTKSSIDKHVFIFPRLVVLRPIYQQFVASMLYQFGLLIDHPWHNNRIKWADFPAIHFKQTRFFSRFISQPQPKS